MNKVMLHKLNVVFPALAEQLSTLLKKSGFTYISDYKGSCYATIENSTGDTYTVNYTHGRFSMLLDRSPMTATLYNQVLVDNLEEVKLLITRQANFRDDFKTLCTEIEKELPVALGAGL